MFIANELRKKNIAEYLLYMWQMEDTVRAFDCSLTRIKREYIERFDYNDEQKEEETDWFGNLIRMMNQEGCREQGHLQINKVTMQMLIELHNQLLQSTKRPLLHGSHGDCRCGGDGKYLLREAGLDGIPAGRQQSGQRQLFSVRPYYRCQRACVYWTGRRDKRRRLGRCGGLVKSQRLGQVPGQRLVFAQGQWRNTGK